MSGAFSRIDRLFDRLVPVLFVRERNGKPSSVGSDDPADTYRGYLSEIRRLDHLTAKELAGHLNGGRP